MQSIFETTGVWKRVPDGGLVHHWGRLATYTPNDQDVAFYWGEHYNWGMGAHARRRFVQQYNIKEIFEIMEYFYEPFNDADMSFRGKAFLVAHFDNINDALVFKLSVPDPSEILDRYSSL